MWVGSLIICFSPNWEVMASVLEPSKVVVSPVYQLLDFALKSPMATIKKGLVVITKVFKIIFGSDWFLSSNVISKVIHSLREWIFINFKGKKFR